MTTQPNGSPSWAWGRGAGGIGHKASLWGTLSLVISLSTHEYPELGLRKESQATQGPFYAFSSEIAMVGVEILCVCGIINFLKSLGSTFKFSA